MTSIGGTNRAGTIYTLNADGNGYRLLHVFGSVAADGENPGAGLIEGSDGGLYGTAFFGGSNGVGTVFRLNKDGRSYGALYHFGQTASDGTNPDTAVVQGADGTLYGTTFFGGTNDAGTVFKVNTNGGGYGVLRMFTKSGGDGQNPDAALMQAGNGALYGTTYTGGASNVGTIFTLSTTGGGYNLLHSFKRFAGDAQSPLGPLLEGKDAVLYGMTHRAAATAWARSSCWPRPALTTVSGAASCRAAGTGRTRVGGWPGERRGILWDDVGRWPGRSRNGIPDLSARDARHARRGSDRDRGAGAVFRGERLSVPGAALDDLVDWAEVGTITMPVSGVGTNVDFGEPR